MVSFGSAPLKLTQSQKILEPEPLHKSILDSSSQAVIMAMEKHAYGREKNKKKARFPSRSVSSSSSTHTTHTSERGKNTLLFDIRKSVQPPTFLGGANTKPEAILSFLGTVENLFDGELSDKEKVRAVSFFVARANPPLVDPC
jgi:hypothetical protein